MGLEMDGLRKEPVGGILPTSPPRKVDEGRTLSVRPARGRTARHAHKKGSSRITGERGADFEEEIFLVAVSVGP
ncbi:hypothetical protein, partial [Burkholderia thailandensis]|uniref:hypothetical protein n=1 Tax=Burkholderia thailandensis TaxID=57975 RepID=UPI0039C75A8B|nr:hypothetical protein [Burkholderia thailandensis]